MKMERPRADSDFAIYGTLPVIITQRSTLQQDQEDEEEKAFSF